MEMDFEEQCEKGYQSYGVKLEDREEWAANMRKQMLEIYYNERCLTPTTKEEQVSLPQHEFLPDVFGDFEIKVRKPEDVMEFDVGDEAADAARKNLTNGFNFKTHVVAPASMMVDFESKPIVYRNVAESTVQDLVYAAERVVLHTGEEAEMQESEEIFPIESNAPITGLAFTVKGRVENMVGEIQTEALSPCVIIPRGEEFAVVHYKMKEISFTVVLFADRSYPAQIFDPKDGAEIFFSALCVERGGILEGPEKYIGDGKILRMWGTNFQLRSYEELTNVQVPSLVHFYDWRKVRALKMNSSTFPVFLSCVFHILEIEGEMYASVRSKMNFGDSVCSGCPLCYQGNCTYMPIFRVPSDFKGRMEFNFFSSRYMPSVNCRMECNKDWHKRYVGFGAGVLIQKSYQAPNSLADYMDLLELITVDDLCRTTFRLVYSRLCYEARPFVTLPEFSYPKCGGPQEGNRDLVDRAKLTGFLLKIHYYPCGRKFSAFNSSVGSNKVHPVHLCEKCQQVLVSGAQMFLTYTFDKGKCGPKADKPPSVKVLKFGQINPTD